jgi:predicted  nucleic acid-binding Zn-ribbon protein
MKSTHRKTLATITKQLKQLRSKLHLIVDAQEAIAYNGEPSAASTIRAENAASNLDDALNHLEAAIDCIAESKRRR